MFSFRCIFNYLFIFLCLMEASAILSAASYSGGSGTSEDPYQIANAEDLITLGETTNDYASCFILTADIDLSGYEFTQAVIASVDDQQSTISSPSSTDTEFTGTFDGNSHIISNLTIIGESCCGLFGDVGADGAVSNLGLKNASVTGTYYVGGLCGFNSGRISFCYTNSAVVGTFYVGGLTGFNHQGEITSCYAAGAVTAIEGSYIGGLCGYDYSSTTSITSCYASGFVSGDDNVGGLVGYCSDGIISSCFFDAEATEQESGIGLDYSTSSDVIGLSTNEMRNMSNFIDAGWDFSADDGDAAVWREQEDWYPLLAWENDIETVTIPDFIGLTSEEAQALAENYSLAIVIGGYDYSSDYEEGTILGQNPASGSLVRSDSRIIVYVSLGDIFSGGSGTAEDPYQIAAVEDLIALGENTEYYGNYFILTADLDLSGYDFSKAVIAGGYSTEFTGSFDGNNHIISNLTISGGYYCSLFGCVDSDGVVTGLGLENVSIAGTGNYASGLCSRNYGTITNCKVSGTVAGDGDYVGGLCGRNYGGGITSCNTNVDVTGGGDYVGGLCGYDYLGTISLSHVSGIVNGEGNYVGGLCGYKRSDTIISCYYSGDVTGGGDYVGGLCGYNYSCEITYCYASGIVTGDECVGGLSGKNYNGEITSCCSLGNVSGDCSVGGLCGANYYGDIVSCYASGDVTGYGDYIGGLCGYNYKDSGIAYCYATGIVIGEEDNSVGGLCGYNYNSTEIANCFWNTESTGQSEGCSNTLGTVTNLTGLTTAEMYNINNFIDAGWDFSADDGDDAVWKELEGLCPVLFWEDFEIITVPDFLGLTIEEAQELADSYSLPITVVGYECSNYYEEGAIFSQTPMSDGLARAGSPVVVYISLGGIFSGGSGTEEDPYQIASVDDLIFLGENTEYYGNYFILKADLDLSDYTFSQAVIAGDNDTDSSFDGVEFTGSFNGNGHIIKNLTISGAYHCGLFGYIDSDGVVTGLGLENVSIVGTGNFAGGLCSRNYGTISCCYSSGDITGDYYIGGVCGYNDWGTISCCYSSGDVTGDCYVGSLCGGNYRGTITCCYSSGAVIGADFVGGFCGGNCNISAVITNCFWDTETSGMSIGCGVNYGTITGYTGLTTVEMQTMSNFIDAGWDFSDDDGDEAVWKKQEGWYPLLAWEDTVELITVPDFSGLTSEEAQILANNSLLAVAVGYEYSNYYEEGTICRQSLKVGNSALVGSEIVVYISLGKVFSGGSGTAEDPYQIATVEDLIFLGEETDFYGKYFILTSDLDLSGYSFSQAVIAGDTDTDYGFDGTKFTGSFNGNGHTISNLIVSGAYYCGLFGYIDFGSTVVDLGLEYVSIVGTGHYVGGVCGYDYSGSITSCYVTGDITGDDYIGGLCGYEDYGSITSCYSLSTVTGGGYVGGLCGYGFYGSITSCYAAGVVAGDRYGGGLCGYLTGDSSEILNCFWDIEITGQVEGCGYCFGTITNLIGLTTAKMQTISNYTVVGWDFSKGDGVYAAWKEQDGWYPLLSWQNDVELVTVPDFSGLTREESQIFADNNLLAIVFCYSYSNYYEEGSVYSQSLKVGNSALVGTEIEVCISLGEIFSGGGGTSEDPYQIATAEDLVSLGEKTDFYSGCFILTSDLDLSGYSFSQAVIAGDTDTGSGFDGVKFIGSFNGNGHVISNLTISGAYYCGLFGIIGSDGFVCNLGLECVSIIGTGDFIGGVCGYDYGSITSCYVTGDITGDDYIGGLSGYEDYGSITSCYSLSAVTGDGYIGGLCGYEFSGSITSCYATGVVKGDGDHVGGLCGNNYGTVTSCYVSGAVMGGGDYVGGLCGNSSGDINLCFSTGAVTGDNRVGGLCGNSNGSLNYSYASGSVTGEGNYVGGLCGYNSGSIASCYASGVVIGESYIGGVCGFQYGGSIVNSFWDIEATGLAVGYRFSYSRPGAIENVTGLTSAEMQNISNFTDAGWDFFGETGNGTEDIWRKSYMAGYPILAYQKEIPGDLSGNYGVDVADFTAISDSWLDGYTISDLQILAQYWLAGK